MNLVYAGGSPVVHPKTGRSVAQLTRQSGDWRSPERSRPSRPFRARSSIRQSSKLIICGLSEHSRPGPPRSKGKNKSDEVNNCKLSRFPGFAKVHKTNVGYVGRILLPRFSTKARANASGSFWQPSSLEEIEREAGLALQNQIGNVPRKQAGSKNSQSSKYGFIYNAYFKQGGVQPSRAPVLGPEGRESKVHHPGHSKVGPVRQLDATKAVILMRPALKTQTPDNA